MYASVAEMKRQKAKRSGGGTLLKLHHSFHSTPELHDEQHPPSNNQSFNHQYSPRHRSHSQSDLNSLNLRNSRQSWIAKFAKKDGGGTSINHQIIPKPPPDEPPPPPPIGQIVKVDVSKAHGDYASVTIANIKKDEVMSSFRPGDSAKLYASPETVNNVGIKSEQPNAPDDGGTLNRVRKYPSTQSTTSRSNLLPPKMNNGPPTTLPQHTCPNNVASSESENSGDSSNAIYSTFKNLRSRSTTNNKGTVDSVSTDSGNSTDKSSFTKEKPLYAKPMLPKTLPFIPDPDYDLSEGEEEEEEKGLQTDQMEKPIVQLSSWEDRGAKLAAEAAAQKAQAQEAIKRSEKEASSKSGPSIVYISGSDTGTSPKNVSTCKIDEKKETATTVDFKDDLAKKIAERNSKIVFINSDSKQVPGKGHKVEIVDVRPGTMRDIVERRREGSGGGVIETSSSGTVRKNISVFERRQENVIKIKVNEHRRSDGMRIATAADVTTDASLIKSSQSFPSDLSQEDSSGISSDVQGQSDGSKQSQNEPFAELVTTQTTSVVAKPSHKIKMGTGQALLMKKSTMDPPPPRKGVTMGHGGASQQLNRGASRLQQQDHRQPARPPVDANSSVRPKNIAMSIKVKDDRCSDLEKSIEESLEMIKMQVDLLSGHGTSDPTKIQELFPPPPGFDSSGASNRPAHGDSLPMAIAPPPEFSDSYRTQNEPKMAHSLPKTKYTARDAMTDLVGTRSHNSSPARQLCNGTIPPTSSLKFDTPTSSLLSSVNGPRLKTIQKEFRNKPLQQWSGKDVSDWLESLFMPEYKTNFTEAGITGTTLATLDSDDLSELGVKRVGHRLNIERSLKRYLMKDRD